jgi:hypothetical protein
LLRGGALAAGLLPGLPGLANQSADDVPEGEPRDLITAEAQRVIERGLAHLAATQNRDGSFGDRLQYHGNVAVTSLAALALMAAGHQPGRGAYGTTVLRALLYVLSREKRNPSGFLHHDANPQQMGMYDHGFGTLFLAEVYGMVPDRALQNRLKGTIERAVRLIETTQSREGGWRYLPEPKFADVSVTICQIMALRSAKNAGFAVNKPTVDLCVKYVRSCQNTDGGYTYFSGQGGSAFARSAAGLVALYSAGIYEGKEVEQTLKYLTRFKPNQRRDILEIHWYYGQYYAAQAMWVAGPRWWNEWFPAIRDELVARARNRADGSWPDNQNCNHYATAMALIILQIPNNYLPILQK